VRTATIANAILRDTLADRSDTAVDLCRCLLCDRTFTVGNGVGINGRFCSRLCLEAFDTGYVHHESGAHYTRTGPRRGLRHGLSSLSSPVRQQRPTLL
jgi:hypothetical protein